MAFNLDKRVGRGPVCLSPGGVGIWDALAVYGPGSVWLLQAGDYAMWYEGVADDGLTDHLTQVGYASGADGVHYSKYAGNPVMVPSAVNWENNENSPGAVIWDPFAGLWKMWFHGGNNTGGSGGGRAIGYASSTDRLVWSKYGSNPVLQKGTSGAWDDRWVADAKVIQLSATDYRMWYGGTRVSDGKRQIGYATSADGLGWTKYPGNPVITWGGSGAFDESDIQAFCPIMLDPFHWIGWYIGLDASGRTAIGIVTSQDGISWTKSGLNPVLDDLTASLSGRPDSPVGSIHVYQDTVPDLYRIVRGSFITAGSVRQKSTDTIRPMVVP